MNRAKYRHNCAVSTLLAWCLTALVAWGQFPGSNVFSGGNPGNPARVADLYATAVSGCWTDCAAAFDPADTTWFRGPQYDPGTNDFIISWWSKLDTLAENQCICCTGAYNTGAAGFRVSIFTNGSLNFTVKDSVQASRDVLTLAASGSANAGEWQHWLVYCDRSANATAYLNGVQQLSADISAHSASLGCTQSGITVGAYDASGSTPYYPVDGSLDSLMLFEKADLSSDIGDIVAWTQNAGSGRLCGDISDANKTAWGGCIGLDLGEAAGEVRADSWGSTSLTEIGTTTIAQSDGVARGQCADGDTLSYWVPVVGSAVSMATYAKRAAYGTAPAIDADGVDDYYDLPSLNGGAASDWTIFLVPDPDAAAGTDEILLGQTELYLCHLTDSAGKVGIYNNGAFASVADASDAKQVLTYVLDSSGATAGKLYRNGVQIGSDFAYVQSTLDAANLFADGDGTGSFYAGKLHAFAIAPSVLPASRCRAIEKVLMNQWGITP